MTICEPNGDPKPIYEWTDDDIAEAQLKADMERSEIAEDRRLDDS